MAKKPAQINLNISRKMFNDKIFARLFDYSSRFEVFMGSAGSGKSYGIAQKMILKALNSKRKMMICRKTGTSIKVSVFPLFKTVLTKFKVIQYCDVSEYNKIIRLPNGSEIIFQGLDEETKLLSLEGFTDIFVEEVFELEKDIWDQLDLRLRSNEPNCQIYAAFNPISANHWLYDFCELHKPDNVFYERSTYKDNKFLPQDYINSLEAQLIRNPRKGQVYVLGEWGTDVDGLVYKNVEHITETDEIKLTNMISNLLKDREVVVKAGLDHGWTDPTAVVLSLYKPSTNEMWVINEFYKRGCQLKEIVAGIEPMNLKKTTIRCDSASPDAIAYLNDKGYKAEAAKKGAGSVNAGIGFLQDMKIYVIDKYCPYTAAEFDNYVYLKDKKTGLYTDKTDHNWSHAMDALRYAYSDLYNKPNKVKLTGKGFYNI